ncbi:MAG: stage II sporulation protein M [Alphaproteobacteria bacterium]|jgi:uncharacterized membrane protein SpoIIM required for sporulation|nr:stage II sporulation protein M [Alphaproteobacteria bacterium]
MTAEDLKSFAFRRQREASWRDLENILQKAEKRGSGRLTAVELLQLPGLYRSALSSLSVARGISLDADALSYLESLAARAYLQIYGTRTGFWGGLASFFGAGFPAAIRRTKWHILASALFIALGVVTSFFLTLGNEDWFYTFISDDMAQGRTPASTRGELLELLNDSGNGVSEAMYVFATFLFTHNAAIGMLCFALGFAFGLPVMLLLFYNGLTLGALAALHESHGLSLEFWAWIAIHGSTELLAVIICGGAGLLLATSLTFPGSHSRLANLALNGRIAARIVIGAVLLFFVAGLLEGGGRQLVIEPSWRYLIAALALAGWLIYFARAGKRLAGKHNAGEAGKAGHG